MWSIRHRRFVPRLLRSACSVARPNRSSRAYHALPALWPNYTEPTANGVNHFWCTPPLLVWTMPGGVDHFLCTPRLVGWTTPRGVDHIWCAPLLAGTSTHFLAVATPSVILPHQHPFLASNIHFRLQKLLATPRQHRQFVQQQGALIPLHGVSTPGVYPHTDAVPVSLRCRL